MDWQDGSDAKIETGTEIRFQITRINISSPNITKGLYDCEKLDQFL